MTMRTSSALRLAACLAAAGAIACSDFLSSDSVSRDPNNPSTATADQLFVAVQAAQFAQQEGIVALIACMWLQQCTGTSNFLQVLEQYGITSEDTPNAAFSAIYEGGGLVDIRKIEAAKAADGDRQYLGIAQVWEVLIMGLAADIYGDVPYREAASDAATPALDPQAQVYGDLQALLDEAIANLGGAGPGPGSLDLVYGGNAAKWIEAANTLKARLYMHTVERDNNQIDATALNDAVTYALLGISNAANDLKSRHTSQPGEDNMWYQFKVRSGFGNFVVAGRALVDLMIARGDPRLPEYFGPSDPGPYGGLDPFGGRSPGGSNTVSLLEGTRNVPAFAQPIVTHVENELILAEAYYRLGQTANAQTHFDNARASVPGLGAKLITSIDDIMEEKYVAMFQSIEVWNDYKRSCYPAIAPVPTAAFDNTVPGRLFYGTSETNANPNVPSRSVQLQAGGNAVSTPPVSPGFRNPNDPNACP
jgi:hypothetical protein